jgi:hypothetical protein
MGSGSNEIWENSASSRQGEIPEESVLFAGKGKWHTPLPQINGDSTTSSIARDEKIFVWIGRAQYQRTGFRSTAHLFSFFFLKIWCVDHDGNGFKIA